MNAVLMQRMKMFLEKWFWKYCKTNHVLCQEHAYNKSLFLEVKIKKNLDFDNTVVAPAAKTVPAWIAVESRGAPADCKAKKCL